MKLREIGEFQLIEQMAGIFRRENAVAADGATAFSRLDVGIGDDAAVWTASPGVHTIATTDAMVEGTHFTRETTDWYDLGWKAMASNVSDIAGMGGVPRYALAVLGTNGDQELEDILDLCRGMADLAERYGARVVGGDTVSSPLGMVSITVVGETTAGRGADGSLPLLSRFSARPGEAIAVTGRLGSSAGGLELLLHGPRPVPAELAPLLIAHRRPVPRVREGQLLVQAGVRCGMDLSDGLAMDLRRICLASRVSALVEAARIPTDPLLRAAFPDRALELAFSGGEDYELLCIAPPELLAGARLLLESVGATLTVVGRVIESDPPRPPVMLVDADGRTYAPKRAGWEHFTADGEAAGD